MEPWESGETITEETKKHIDFGCPMCGGAMEYDPAGGELHCPYCEHRMKIGEEGEVAEQDFSQAEHVEGFSWGAQQKQVICRSCGAQSIYDALETSGICPFCGSNQVLEEAVDTSMPPNGICPFEVTREAAVLKFKKWIKRRLFTPSAAKKQARPETMNGIYLPYWTFDSKTSTFYTARYGIDRVYRDSKGNTRTKTTWYRTSGTYERFIDDQLVCASARHDVKMLRGVEPYDTKASKHYRPEYLSGLASERYSLGLQDGWETAKGFINQTLEREIAAKIKRECHADHVDRLRMSTAYSDITYKYLLLPLWKSSYCYKEKRYHFAVNGQTGKVSGKAPISALRVAIAVLLALAAAVLLFVLFSGAEESYYYDYDAAAISESAVCEVIKPPPDVCGGEILIETEAWECLSV
jgi:predicted RNA-binding Zn-ribbon protein involved in translation (DUF1610 family)